MTGNGAGRAGPLDQADIRARVQVLKPAARRRTSRAGISRIGERWTNCR
ncbi:hypothetical protein [Streptomyces sp. NPDC091263]